MLNILKQSFNLLSFSRQFLLAIIAVLLVGMVTIGTWMGKQIEASALNRAAAATSVYVESLSTAQLHDWTSGQIVDNEMRAMFDKTFVEGPMHREVLRFKLWDVNGRIDYSTDHSQIGLRYPLKRRLMAAFDGTVQANISDVDQEDNENEYALGLQLLDVYVPIYTVAHDKIIGVAEFYLSVENLKQEIRTAQQRSWALVAFSTLAIYVLLYSLVRGADNTIQKHQRDLRDQLDQLRKALDENGRMREQLREAGINTTTLNEEFLIRIAADIHDGPAQTIAYALMRFDEFASICKGCTLTPHGSAKDLHGIKSALETTLRDVRRISTGLAIPGIAELSLADTARRAVKDFERLTGQSIQSEIDGSLDRAPISTKITVYRLLQESLTNCLRHAPGGVPKVAVQRKDTQVMVTITDQGAGFVPESAAVSGRLGLTFMRERVRLLGGNFEIISAPGQGTSIRAQLTLSTVEELNV